MPVVFMIAIAIVLAAIVVTATGRGGELAYEHADHAPLDLGPVSAADIALLRPPTAMWGYNMQVTDAALDQIARAMRERDVTIAYLREQLADPGRNGSCTEPRGAQALQDPWAPLALDLPESPESSVPYGISVLDEIFEASATAGPPVPADPSGPPGPREPASQAPASPIPGPPGPREPASQAPASPIPGPPRTPLVLKAKAPRTPEPHEITQPSEAREEPHETTQPSGILDGPHEITQPSATLPPPDQQGQQGPQGSFATYGWWAEQQQEAAREGHEQEEQA